MNNKFIYAFGILILLVILYIFNINKQNSYLSSTSQLFDIDKNQIKKILIQSKGDALEIEKIDTSWAISGHDSLNIKIDLLKANSKSLRDSHRESHINYHAEIDNTKKIVFNGNS